MPIYPPDDTESFAKALEKIKKEVISEQEKKELLNKYFKIPEKERKKFFESLQSNHADAIGNQLLDNFLDDLASQLHGFVGADLAALAKESAMKALRRYESKIDFEKDTIPPEVLESLEVNKNDFVEALKEVQPSALREVLVEIPNVKWTDIGALDEVKEELKQAVEWPLKNPDAFKKMGIKPPIVYRCMADHK